MYYNIFNKMKTSSQKTFHASVPIMVPRSPEGDHYRTYLGNRGETKEEFAFMGEMWLWAACL